jgi:hypothetical protein
MEIAGELDSTIIYDVTIHQERPFHQIGKDC